jgi:hypothetical protein
MGLYLYDFIEDPALVGTSGGFAPPFGSAIVRAYSPGGAFSPHNWLEWNGQFLEIGLLTGVPLRQATFWFAWKFEGPFCSGPIFQTMGQQAPSGNLISTSSLVIEKDNTLSGYVSGSPGSLAFNSGGGSNPFYVQSNVWYYFQVGITLAFSAAAPYFLQSTFNVFVDSATICTSATATSNFLVGPTPPLTSGGSFINGEPGFTAIEWLPPNGSGNNGLAEFYAGTLETSVAFPGNLWTLVVTAPGSGYLSSDTVNTGGDATIGIIVNGSGGVTSLFPKGGSYLGDSYPNSPPIITLTITSGTGSGFTGYATVAPNPNKRISQMATEIAGLPTNSNLRINQMGVEIAGLPSPRLRISQMVIELPYKNAPGGWIVKEC